MAPCVFRFRNRSRWSASVGAGLRRPDLLVAENCTNWAIDCAAWLGCNVNASDVVTGDFAADAGPIKQCASGFIGADCTNTNPPDALFLPIRPRLLSWQMGCGAFARAEVAGIRHERNLSDKSATPSSVTGF